MGMYKLSLHSHTSDFAKLIFTHPNKKLYLINLISILLKKHGNIVMGVSNFDDDNRYKALLDTAKLLPKEYNLAFDCEECFFSITFKGKSIFFVKTDEIETDKGHILIVGYTGKVRKRKLDNILKEAHRQHCIIIANHPLHTFGIGYFMVKKIMGGNSKISLGKEELNKHKQDFDALELNSYFPKDWKKVKDFAKNIHLPVVSDSDAHFLNEIFTSWYEIENLSFESPKKFKKSLKKGLKNSLHLHAVKYGYEATYKHALQVIFEKLGKKIGLIFE